ncbi:MAG: hypothetical protein LUG95_03935 [Clostridiales bacterium]|nr:hypothetical protein [Clostridiales bacterium]
MKNNFNAQFLLSEDEINILLRHYKNALKSIHQYKADPYFSQIDAEKESVEFKKFTDICAMMINKIKNPQSPVDACANLKYGYRVAQVSVLEPNSKENIMYDEYARISCRDAFTVGRDANNVLIQKM